MNIIYFHSIQNHFINLLIINFEKKILLKSKYTIIKNFPNKRKQIPFEYLFFYYFLNNKYSRKYCDIIFSIKIYTFVKKLLKYFYQVFSGRIMRFYYKKIIYNKNLLP